MSFFTTFFSNFLFFFFTNITFFFAFALLLIYSFFSFLFSFTLLNLTKLGLINYAITTPTFLFHIYTLNPLYVYYFPFMYIFLLITLLALYFCLAYNKAELLLFLIYVCIIIFAGVFIFFTDSLLIFFFAYELLLIPSFFILYKFAKTRRCIEAAFLMFFWTQFGALFLLLSFLYFFFVTKTTSLFLLSFFFFSKFEINFLFICWLIGFGVKFPLWPFYGWLPKAHVEASTNFSIFLSGVLVKFAFFGFLKCLFALQLEPTFFYVYPFLLIGLTDAVFKLFYQIDLKKIVAYSTVIEMHWLTICVISGQSCLILANFCMLISHALLSTNSFLLVDAINRRFKTRLITEINGINVLCPKLFLICLFNCLLFLGFPGSIFFIAEILFFSFFFDLFPILALVLLILLYLFNSIFFFKNWITALFGFPNFYNTKVPMDLSSKEWIIYLNLLLLMYWLGFTWQSFIF